MQSLVPFGQASPIARFCGGLVPPQPASRAAIQIAIQGPRLIERSSIASVAISCAVMRARVGLGFERWTKARRDRAPDRSEGSQVRDDRVGFVIAHHVES